MKRRTRGKCDRWIRVKGDTCGRLAKRTAYSGRHMLCNQCYDRWKAGRETLFEMPKAATVEEQWALQQRLMHVWDAREINGE